MWEYSTAAQLLLGFLALTSTPPEAWMHACTERLGGDDRRRVTTEERRVSLGCRWSWLNAKQAAEIHMGWSGTVGWKCFYRLSSPQTQQLQLFLQILEVTQVYVVVRIVNLSKEKQLWSCSVRSDGGVVCWFCLFSLRPQSVHCRNHVLFPSYYNPGAEISEKTHKYFFWRYEKPMCF